MTNLKQVFITKWSLITIISLIGLLQLKLIDLNIFKIGVVLYGILVVFTADFNKILNKKYLIILGVFLLFWFYTANKYSNRSLIEIDYWVNNYFDKF